jgi:hypothetical protein
VSVTVVLQYAGDCPHRAAAFEWVSARYASEFPEWEQVVGTCEPAFPYNRSAAIIDGARKASGDTLVVADGDVWVDGLEAAVGFAETSGWSTPHRLIHRLSQASTDLVLGGRDWRGLPLSQDNEQDDKPYIGNDAGTLLVIRKELLFAVPPDVRFVGWGQEDVAWGLALRTLHGNTRRTNADLVHLWHPPQPRMSRQVGNPESLALVERYREAARQKAATRKAAMQEIIDEARQHAGINP